MVNFPAGGLTDGIARSFGQHVQQATGQQVIIDNKPGASGNIGAALVARAPADGYTLLHSVSSTLVQNRVMFKSLGFDPDKDLTIISGTRRACCRWSCTSRCRSPTSRIRRVRQDQQGELRLVGDRLVGPHLRPG